MPVEYEIVPDTMQDASGTSRDYFQVNIKNNEAFWSPSQGQTDNLWNFRDLASAESFVKGLQANGPDLENLDQGKPVTIAGVRYLPDANGLDYAAENGPEDNNPLVGKWEIQKYLLTGTLSPNLAANAIMDPEKLKKLSDFEKEALKNFAYATQEDGRFIEFHLQETEAYRKWYGVDTPQGMLFNDFTIDAMPSSLREFVAHPQFSEKPALQEAAPAPTSEEPEQQRPEPENVQQQPGTSQAPLEQMKQRKPIETKVPSPAGGLDITHLAEGATLLYSRADAPDTLSTGVLMHNQSTMSGSRMDIINNEGLRERLYIGQDQSTEAAHNRIAAVIGYMLPCDKPVFIEGVGADGKMIEPGQTPQSFGIFYHNENYEAIPVGQAITADLAESLKFQIEQNQTPTPVENPGTIADLNSLKDGLNSLTGFDDLRSMAGLPKAEPDPMTPPRQNGSSSQTPRIHISDLLLYTANSGQTLALAVPSQDTVAWQHSAHAHLDQAQKHLNIIAQHPVVQEYAKMMNLPDMPQQAKAAYGQAIFNNNPDLMQHYDQVNQHAAYAQSAVDFARQNGLPIETALSRKSDYLQQCANSLPGTMQAAINPNTLYDLANQEQVQPSTTSAHKP